MQHWRQGIWTYRKVMPPLRRGTTTQASDDEPDMQPMNTLHLVIQQMLFSRGTYSKYRDILPEASRVKCLAQGHNVIWRSRELIRQPSDYQPDSLTTQPPDSLDTRPERKQRPPRMLTYEQLGKPPVVGEGLNNLQMNYGLPSVHTLWRPWTGMDLEVQG